MANGNGINGSMKLISWTAGVVGLLITIYTVFHVPVVKAIAQEADARCAGDNDIKKEVNTKLDKISEQNTQTAVMLAQLSTDMRYLRKDNGRP